MMLISTSLKTKAEVDLNIIFVAVKRTRLSKECKMCAFLSLIFQDLFIRDRKVEALTKERDDLSAAAKARNEKINKSKEELRLKMAGVMEGIKNLDEI
jgi:hypothetical protein